MLSIETRERLVRGYERTHDAKMIAQAYGVSEREVYKLAAQMLETGSVEPRTGNCGRKPKLSEEDLKRLDKAIQAQPDITFGELIMNLKLDIIASEEGPGYGGALLAAVGCSEYPDVETAAKTVVKVTEVIEPDPELTKKYEEKYRKFKDLYPMIKDWYY